MNRMIWKTIFFITLTIFTILTILLIAFVFNIYTSVPPSNTSIIGGADQPTLSFILSMILRSALFNIWLGSLMTVAISLIGWLTSKK